MADIPSEAAVPVGTALGQVILQNGLLIVLLIFIAVCLWIGGQRFVAYKLGVRKMESDARKDENVSKAIDAINKLISDQSKIGKPAQKGRRRSK